jgi:hypothetical protein
MRYFWAVVGANLVSMLAVGGAIWLMYLGRDGWGWLLFIALCCATTLKMGNIK